MFYMYSGTYMLLFGLSVLVGIVHTESPSPCDLNCWLHSLRMHFPPLHIDPSSNDYYIDATVSNLVCTNLGVAVLSSAKNDSTAELSVAFSGITISCTADWEASWLRAFSGSGGAVSGLKDSSVDLGFQLVRDKQHPDLAGSAKSLHCRTILEFTEIVLSGSWLPSHILKAFQKQIVNLAQAYVDKKLCSEFSLLVDTNLTQILHQINTDIAPYLNASHEEASGTSSTLQTNDLTSEAYAISVVPLASSPFVGLADYYVNTVILPEIPRLVHMVTGTSGTVTICNTPSNASSKMQAAKSRLGQYKQNTRLRQWSTQSSASKWRPPQCTISAGLPPLRVATVYGNASFSVDHISLVGLADIDRVIMGRPCADIAGAANSTSPTLLCAQLATPRVAANLSLSVEVRVPAIAPNTLSKGLIPVLSSAQNLALRETAVLSLSVDNFSVDAAADLKVLSDVANTLSEEPLMTMEAGGGCVSRAMRQTDVESLKVEMDDATLLLRPPAHDDRTLEGALDELISNVFNLFVGPAGFGRSTAAMVNWLLDTQVKVPANEYVANAINESVRDYPCVDSPTEFNGGVQWHYCIGYILGGAVVALWLIYLVSQGRRCHALDRAYAGSAGVSESSLSDAVDADLPLTETAATDRQRSFDSIDALNRSPVVPTRSLDDVSLGSDGECVALLRGGTTIGEKHHAWLCGSLSSSNAISPLLAHGIMLLIVGSFVCFLMTTTSYGGAVLVWIEHGGVYTKLPPVFTFRLAETIQQMWDSGMYALSSIIAIFSAFWPYCKLALMAMCWVLPRRMLPAKHCERLLIAVDALGKWSLVDSLILTLMMVSFNYHLVTGPSSVSSDSSIYVFVQPYFGFYGFILCTLISMAISHIQVAAFRRRQRTDSSLLEDPNRSTPRIVLPQMLNQSIQVLSGAVFRSDHTEEAVSLHRSFSSLPADLVEEVSEGTKIPLWKSATEHKPRSTQLVLPGLVVFLMVGSLVILGIALGKPSFSFEVEGAAKMFFHWMVPPFNPLRSFSILDVAVALWNIEVPVPMFGIRLVAFFWVLFAICTPILHCILLIVVWVTPVGHTTQRRLFIACEIFNAWSCPDVLVVCLLGTVLQLKHYISYVVGHHCDAITPILASLDPEFYPYEGKCVDLKASLLSGSWFLFAGTVVYVAISWTIMRLCHKEILRRVERLKTLKHTAQSPSLRPSRDVSTLQ